MEGIKELREAYCAVEAISLLLVERLKDGIGMDDATAVIAKIMGDEEFKAKVEAGYKDIGKIPAEIADLSVEEGFELAGLGLGTAKKVIDALKK